jgi:hypothetical protein
VADHILPSAINTITRWHSFWDLRVLLHPLRPFIQKYHGDIIKNYIRLELEQRFTELKEELLSTRTMSSMKKSTSAVSLALKAFFDENRAEDILGMKRLDDRFAEILTNQIRLFLFAGNDTTSSTMVFTQHLLFQHPDVVSELRKEHNNIFGTDVSQAAVLLRAQPALLNQCKYTLAVVKETMRIYPPATSMRQGTSQVDISTLSGEVLRTDGLYVIVNHIALHQNPRVWVKAEEFIPERWLVDPDHYLYPPLNAYRPFDAGPRACIGQTLSLIEMRLVIIMMARSFDVKPAYDEWDGIQAGKETWLSKTRGFLFGHDINTVRGDRAYQTDNAGTHPSDGYPCRVVVVKQ